LPESNLFRLIEEKIWDLVPARSVEMPAAAREEACPNPIGQWTLLAELESAKTIRIAGAMYNLETGAVDFYPLSSKPERFRRCALIPARERTMARRLGLLTSVVVLAACSTMKVQTEHDRSPGQDGRQRRRKDAQGVSTVSVEVMRSLVAVAAMY